MRLSQFVILEPKCQPKSIDGNVFEALIGALYLDKGYMKTKNVIINKLFLTIMDLEAVLQEEHNFKSKLINWAQKKNLKVRFNNRSSDNQKGRKLFISQCFINDSLISEAEDFKVKKADQLAAQKAWNKLHNNNENA
jgi:ribonuclease-3